MGTQRSPFIDDGYTEDFVLPAGEYWPQVKGKFRPMAAPDWATFMNAAAQANQTNDREASTKVQITALLGAVKSWDLLDSQGKLVAISEASFSRLRKIFLEALWEATLGPSMWLKRSDDEKN